MKLGSDVRGFAGFLLGLPAFLRQRMTVEHAREIVHRRMRERESNFLASLEHGIYRNPNSPYRALLRMARCELGDVRAMVAADGLEPTLRALRDAGVYVSFDEFKGVRPIERNGRVIRSRPTDFDNPAFARYTKMSTGGSTGRGRSVLMDLTHLSDRLTMDLLGDVFHE